MQRTFLNSELYAYTKEVRGVLYPQSQSLISQLVLQDIIWFITPYPAKLKYISIKTDLIH